MWHMFHIAHIKCKMPQNAACKVTVLAEKPGSKSGGGGEAGTKGTDVTIRATVEPQIYIFFAYKHVSNSAGYMQD